MFTIQEIIIALFSLIYITFIANFAIAKTVTLMWTILQLEVNKEGKNEEVKPRPWQAEVIGTVERILFVFSLLSGNEQFIGLWLGLKTVSQYTRWSNSEIGRATFNIFLAGNALSLLYTVAGYGLIELGKKIHFTSNIFAINTETLILFVIGIFPLILSGIIQIRLNNHKKNINKNTTNNKINLRKKKSKK